MFTNQFQQVIEAAKRDAFGAGSEELRVEFLLAAAARSAECSLLLSRCLDIPLAKIREVYPPLDFSGTLFDSPMSPDAEAKEVLAQSIELASLEPDRLHPGWANVRHLACALAMSPEACKILEATAVTREKALKDLQDWYEMDSNVPGLADLSDNLRTMRSSLLQKVFGQDHAVHAFVEGLFNAEIVAYADINRKRPKAIFAFAGPPGVGKTFLAELGAEALKMPFKRFDMSSYSDHQAYMALVGFPPSFQAAKEGVLTGFVKENPTAFLLFDEIEKAHLTTVNLFLQILDAGRLEDKFTAEDVSFRDTVIIFTTNAGKSLYDRPNETGVLSANSSFHRQTILDALRTEKGPSGEPFFPPAVCSRLATGYPIMFNHLGINELQKIARTEIERVISLVAQQYFKSVTYDDCLPLAMVLREGANTDARTVRSQSGIFVQTELFKFTDLFTRQRLERVWEESDQIHFGLELNLESDDTRFLFEPPEKIKALLIASEALGQLVKEHVPDVEWITASTHQDAMQTLASTEVDLVLLDIWLGRDKQSLTRLGTVGMFDFVPLASRGLEEGARTLQAIHQRLAGLPVYLLSFSGPEGTPGVVDENLFLACVRSGGARGVINTQFVTTDTANWQNKRDAFSRDLRTIALRMYREKKVVELGQQRKVLAFDTAPSLERPLRRVNIRLRNLHLSRAISAEDASEVMSEVERPNVRFADVFGADSAKETLQFVVDWLRNPRHYAALGVRPPRGILLTGSPGTGKTMLARSVAGESEVAFLVASGTDFVTIWQGSGPQNVRELFARARRYAPSIVFIDEIDAIGKKRMGLGTAGQAEETTLNALLTEMDGFGSPTLRPVIVLAATNLSEHLDDALRRRFDREIEVPPPDRDARAAYLGHELLGRETSQVTQETIDILASRSAGMTIADLRRIVNEAAVMAARKASPLTDDIVNEAFEKIRMGEASRTPDAKTLERIARHEAGHALIGWLTGNIPVQITIVGRGSAGGYVEKEAQEEKIIYTFAELKNHICQSMAGRAAELLYYGDLEGLSTGVGSDLRQATHMAERMIREFGMSPEIGQIYLDEREVREGALAGQVNEAAENIIRAQLERGLKALRDHKDYIDKLSTELLSKNRLDRSDLERILPPPGGLAD
jgi:cell division protease FtsH